MQRMIEAPLVYNLWKKYSERFNECQAQWDKDCIELQNENINADRKDFLLTDIASLNVQISAYECIVKDLKELIK